MSTLKKTISSNKQFIMAVIIYGLYLLILFRAINFLVPCLNNYPGESYTDVECHITLALDRFIGLAVIGFIITSLILFITQKPKSIKRWLLYTGFLAILTIGAYYLYILAAQPHIDNAQIILDPASFNQ